MSGKPNNNGRNPHLANLLKNLWKFNRNREITREIINMGEKDYQKLVILHLIMANCQMAK
jgi:predicted NUDIX family phosphoesterase